MKRDGWINWEIGKKYQGSNSISFWLLYIANFAAYEIEDDVLANLQEFTFANSIYWALVEGHASEMCAKRAAMENATSNAGDMITKLTMTYNRGRQAVITNELSKYFFSWIKNSTDWRRG